MFGLQRRLREKKNFPSKTSFLWKNIPSEKRVSWEKTFPLQKRASCKKTPSVRKRNLGEKVSIRKTSSLWEKNSIRKEDFVVREKTFAPKNEILLNKKLSIRKTRLYFQRRFFSGKKGACGHLAAKKRSLFKRHTFSGRNAPAAISRPIKNSFEKYIQAWDDGRWRQSKLLPWPTMWTWINAYNQCL